MFKSEPFPILKWLPLGEFTDYIHWFLIEMHYVRCSQNANALDVLIHFVPINRSYWQYITWNAYKLFIKIIIYDCTWWSLFEIFQHLFTISKEFSPTVHLDCSDWMAHVHGASAMGLTGISWQGEMSLFLGWLHSPQDTMTTAWANHSQQLLQHVYKIP